MGVVALDVEVIGKQMLFRDEPASVVEAFAMAPHDLVKLVRVEYFLGFEFAEYVDNRFVHDGYCSLTYNRWHGHEDRAHTQYHQPRVLP